MPSASESLALDRLATAPDLPQRLAAMLAARSSDRRGGARFAHEISYGRHFGPAPYNARPAAVIALLFRRDGQWHIPLTLRHSALGQHGGQISLPGGSVDAGETAADAACRELDEELGVGDSVELIGKLA